MLWCCYGDCPHCKPHTKKKEKNPLPSSVVSYRADRPLVCLLVAGPGGHRPPPPLPPPPHLHHHVQQSSGESKHPLVPDGSARYRDGGSSRGSPTMAVVAAALQHHQHHQHQMSYHNMFSPTRELAGTMWRCRTCGKEVTNRWHHFHSHTAQRSMCPYCPATYSRIDTLRSHLRVKHPDRLIKN